MKSDDYCDYCKHKEKCGSFRSCVFKGIEVEPVRRGEWVISKDLNKRVCSCCGADAHWAWTRDVQILSLYCPNCGSKNGVS